ncbi:hypothetical protein CANINC_003028 [Pichia inconspicua]|uniref:Gfd2/YDR514C-like C-terminal domain-containing protein n=1 Tax=Pichia inconspicua TaxID=52247 RepID=A0A4T0X1A6_9ASCO|nr:hypothetical protein CANINC_003028 [[Candida] inconspicua]
MEDEPSYEDESDEFSDTSISEEIGKHMRIDRNDLLRYDLKKSPLTFKSFKSIEKYLQSQLKVSLDQLPANYAGSANKSHEKSKSNNKSKQHIKLSVKETIELLNKRTHNLISIDNEFFERQNSKVTEIGICIYNPSYQSFSLYPHFLSFHFIIKDYINLRNGHFVPDSKMNNITGQSIVISKSDLPKAMNIIFEHLGPDSCIVGHNVAGDIESFKYLKYNLPTDLCVIDTMDLWQSLIGSKSARSSLSYILDSLNVPNAFLHNGANDAYYTLVVCLMLSSPEIRNNIIFRTKKSIEDELRAAAEIKQKPVIKEMPDFSQLPAEEAALKESRWLRKQEKAAKKANKTKSLPINTFDLIKIRCAIDDEAIIKKHKGSSLTNSRRQKNPAVNNFFKPISYEEKHILDKLKELNV